MTDKHADIRESLAKITPGEWNVDEEFDDEVEVFIMATDPEVPGRSTHVFAFHQDFNLKDEDAQFIANSPSYVRRLLDEVDRLEKERQHMFRDSVWEREERLKQDEEIERLRKALTEIYEMETLCDQPSLFNSLLTINEISRKALDGGAE